MATEDPMQFLAANNIRGVLRMASNGQSTGGTGMSSNSAQDNITQELGMLLRSHTRLDNLLSRRDPGSYRSGSAPPSVEGSFSSIGGLFTNQLPGTGEKSDADSELEIRSDPAYLVYYYSNVNLNPRLPPPLVTRDNYLLAQRLAGDKRTLKSVDDINSRSLFSTLPPLPTHNEEPEICEDDKFLKGHLTKQLHGEHLHSKDGLMGLSQGTRPKSLVDLIQEDFPRTPSPVFTQLRPSSRVANEENTGLDGQLTHLLDSSVSAAAVAELSAALLGSRSTTPVPSLANTTVTSIGTPGNVCAGNGPLASPDNAVAATDLAVSLQNLDLADQQLHSQNNFGENYFPAQLQSAPMHSPHGFHQHQQEKPSRLESSNRVQGKSNPLRPPSPTTGSQPGTAPNLNLATAAAANANATAMSYMPTNPYYPNLNSYSPSYNGYPTNPGLFPSMMPNYPSPMPHDTGAGVAAGMGIRAPLPANGGGSDMQHLFKYTGQVSSPISSQFNDPLYYHYLQQYFAENCRNSMIPVDPMQRGYCMDSMEMQKGHANALFGHHADQKSSFPRIGPYGVPMGSKNGSLSPSYYGSPPGVDFMLPYGSSPITSPVLPGSPVHHGGLSARQGDRNLRFSLNANRNTCGGPYMGWTGQNTGDMGEESKTTSLLEELKNNKARRFELSDILGHVVEFSADQHGSRFIQQKLETVSLEEKAAVFEEVLPHALVLMTDVFGNYVIQKFFEHGSPVQRSELAEKVVGHVLSLSLQMYGCRVIQKALEVLDVEQQIGLIAELDGQVMRCVRDQNGNHVIQKCIECVPPQHINFILSAFHGQIVMLSTHPYGCRVIQRVLEHCTEEQKQNGVMPEILRSVCILAQDQYGNYVVQHILEHGKPEERSDILTKMAGQIVQMSQHKFASNVVEKCLEFCGPDERQILITEMLGQTDDNEPLQAMMKDQFANYVVQKVLETCDDQQREMLLSRIRVHLHGLKKYTYGKHIVARVEKLVTAGERRSAMAALMTAT